MINKFLVISGSAKKVADGSIWGYGPYITELNIWLKYVNHAVIIAPQSKDAISPIDIEIKSKDIKFIPVPEVSVKSPKEIIRALFYSPYILFVIFIHGWRTELIHLRAPSNLGFLGSIAQIFLPQKRKIAKYAANFDFNSKQPLFNRLQRSILNNPTLTQNIQMLVYGTWPNASKNCVPFFTASYSEKDIEETPPRLIRKTESIKLLFVGTLRSNKKPMLSIQVCQELRRMGHSVTLDLYGDGPERRDLESYIEANKIGAFVKIHGNQSREVVKKAFKTSHFLIFISKSEGWPKVVAESMFWGCVPITTAVSMVPEMLGNQKRGILIEPDTQSAVNAVTQLLSNHEMYHEMSELAMQWARSFTIDKFELEIQRLIENQ